MGKEAMLIHCSEVVKKVKELQEMGERKQNKQQKNPKTHHYAIINTKHTSILNIVCGLGQSISKTLKFLRI